MAKTLFEYYKSRGQALPGIKERSKTFEEFGLGSAEGFRGTAEQNIALLKRLETIPPTPAPKAPVALAGTPGAPAVAPNLPGSAPVEPRATVSTPSAPIADRYEKLLGELETAFKGIPSKSKLYTEELGARNVEPQRQQLRSLDERIAAMERAIGESEEDIRKRTIQSGGLVTESQTQRLVAAEKEPLIRSYRNLLDERNRLAQRVGEEETRAGTVAGLKFEEGLQPLESLKTRLGIEKDISELSRGGKPLEVGGNLVQYNPKTGKYETIFAKPTSDLDLIKLDQAAQRLELAKEKAESAAEKARLQGEINQIKLEQMKAQAEFKPRYKAERVRRITESIDSVVDRVGYLTSGIAGKASESIPGTPAYDLAQDIISLKSNIAENELQEMREASKTGGAVGQVAIQEWVFLSSVLGALDIGQSPNQLKRNLEKVKQSVEKWRETKDTVLSPEGGQNNDPLGIR
ncbi:hypothetical protein HY406_01835 [Candidatus Giovannonibacteria bacterium]|nr:hypothetical protein [Candidatus Giovannonibacteria bacterium]